MMGCQAQERLSSSIVALVLEGNGCRAVEMASILTFQEETPGGKGKVGGVCCSAPAPLPELFSEGEAGKRKTAVVTALKPF